MLRGGRGQLREQRILFFTGAQLGHQLLPFFGLARNGRVHHLLAVNLLLDGTLLSGSQFIAGNLRGAFWIAFAHSLERRLLIKARLQVRRGLRGSLQNGVGVALLHDACVFAVRPASARHNVVHIAAELTKLIAHFA